MPNTITVSVENPDELLNAGAYGAGALIGVETSATEAGAYAALTGTGSTPTIAIVAATRSYTGYDPNGDGSSWYRTRYQDSGAVRLSDWSDPFQVGGETGGLMCSVYDVKQALGITGTGDDENILEYIRQVSTAIEGYTERWFAPRPLSGTTTYRMHSRYGRVLRLPKGIRSITDLSMATSDQPASGGTYGAAAAASDYYIEPPEMERSYGWPGTSIRLTSTSSALLYDASFGVEITGEFGWASVPYDIQGIAVRAVIRRFIGKGGGGTAVAVGPAGTEFLLPDMSGADRTTLEWYRAR